MQGLFHGVREYLTPVLKESSFEDKGLLTPEEFVKAGDLLVYKCPTWRWYVVVECTCVCMDDRTAHSRMLVRPCAQGER